MTEGVELIFEVRPQDFDRGVLEASRERPVVVDFWAPWCAPCRVLGPTLERVVSSLQGRAVLAKVNIEEDPNFAAKWGISGIPAVKVFKDGRIIGEFVGALPESEIRRQLSAVLPSKADELVAQADESAAKEDWPEAEARYREALAIDLRHARASVRLAEAVLARGDYQEAKKLVSTAASASPQDAAIESLLNRIWFIERCAENGGMALCRRKQAQDPQDMTARFDCACCLAAEGAYGDALEGLLDLVRADRTYGKGAPKEAMVRIFSALGEQSELTRQYRRRLSRELYV
jgi:putative thioredoxin